MSRRTRSGNPLVAVAYLRVSTEDQRLGPDAQLASIQQWARANGVTIAATFTDQGVSGAAGVEERPGLLAALATLRTLGAGLLVAGRRDRIARDVVVAAMVERAAEAAGARVVCADGSASGDAPADAFMRTVLDGAAAYERALIRSRTKAALAQKKSRGERVSRHLPYGFRLDADGVRLVADEAEQKVIAIVRELRAAGMSLRAVSAELETRGLVGRTGRAFAPSAIQAMEAAE